MRGNLYGIDFSYGLRKAEKKCVNAESELKYDELLLRDITDASPVGYLAADAATGRVLYCNSVFCEMWKIEIPAPKIHNGEISIKDIFLRCLPMFKDSFLLPELFRALRHQDVNASFNVEISLADSRSVKLSSSFIHRSSGAVRLCVFEDITASKNFENMLRYRHDYEHFVFSISSKFINARVCDIDNVIVDCLKNVCEFTGTDHGLILLFNAEKTESRMAYWWNNGKIKLESSAVEKSEIFPWKWSYEKLCSSEILKIEDTSALPEEAAFEKKFWKQSGISSSIMVPLVYGNELKGLLVFESVSKRNYSDDIISLLGLLSGTFTNAIMHKLEYEGITYSEERLRLLIQNAADVITVFDTKGNYIYNSPAVTKIFGYHEDNWRGKCVFDFIHPDDILKAKDLLERVVAEKGFSSGPVQLRIKHADGIWRYIETRISNQLDNPAIQGIIANSNDVTHHVELEHALENSSRFLNKIINSIGDPFFVKDREHKYVLLNEAFCTFVGRRREDLLGMDDYKIFPKKEADSFWAKDELVFSSGERNISEDEIKADGGNEYYVSTRRDLYSDKAEGMYIIGTIRDETGKKEAELNILNALSKEKELNDLKSKFISMVSHEYRTPLTSILSSIELLELFGAKMQPAVKQEHFDKIKKSVEFLTDMLNDVLLINRKERGKLEFSPCRLELVSFCGGIIKELAHGEANRIRFNSNVTELLVPVDGKLCKYILSNLIGNALKYSPADTLIDFNLEYSNQTVSFEIADRGIGIPEKDLHRLFDPFFRAGNTLNIPGSGLGLSTVKMCLELHRGEISVSSKQGEGSVFKVTLPAVLPEELALQEVRNEKNTRN